MRRGEEGWRRRAGRKGKERDVGTGPPFEFDHRFSAYVRTAICHNTYRTSANDRIMSGNGRSLRRLLTIASDLRHQKSQAVLEFAVLGGVDERVDTAVGEHQHHTHVVRPASEVERVAEIVAKEKD